MADPIASLIVTADLNPVIQAAYLKSFLKEVMCLDTEVYDKYGYKEELPIGQYGDTTNTGDTGGDAYRTAGLYTGRSDGFKVTGWDDLGFYMNYGFTVDGVNDADYTADGSLNYNFSDFEIAEGTSYASGTDYRAHNKALTNKFYVNIPIVRFGATNQYDTLAWGTLVPAKDTEELMKQFGKQAKMVKCQYQRATLINMATQIPAYTFTNGGTDIELEAFVTLLNTVKSNLKLRGGEQIATRIKASDGVGTLPGRGGFVAIISSQMENVIQKLPGFLHFTKYGNEAGLLENEFGMVPETEIRFVTNDVIVRQSGTSSVGVVDTITGATLTGYNMLIMAKDAYCNATLKGNQQYSLYIDAPGKGNDTLRNEKNTGWKTIMGCAVTRPAWINNIPITLTTV